MDNEAHEVDEQLEELAEQLQDLHVRNLNQSAVQTGKELRRRARQFQRIVPYLQANFHLMNCSQSLFEPEFGADIAIESIALLESEEKARQIQPDLPQDAYDYFVHWMSSCSYDNLAKHVAQREGYNSDGVHDCINDGIQICRQTGKLECITCFREYATDVYVASDDIDMALHHARAVSQAKRDDSDNDRRWVGTKNTARLLMLSGQLDAALDSALDGLRLVDTYHSPIDALPMSLNQIETILWLLGRHDELESLVAGIPVEQKRVEIPSGEDLAGELDDAKLAAIAACCQGDFDTATKLLSDWDQKLTQFKCLDTWFEIRLQLIAAYRMAGDADRVKGLARQLEAKAKPARDWHSLRLLKLMQTDVVPLAPLPFSEPPMSGPFSSSGTSQSAVTSSSEDTGTAAQSDAGDEIDAAEETTPLTGFFEELQQNFQSAETREDAIALLQQVTGITPGEVSSLKDAERLIHVAGMLAPAGTDHGEVWAWAADFLVPFGQQASILNLVAYLGHSLLSLAEDDTKGLPTEERIEELFRQSLDLDTDRAGNFARAGDYYLSEGRVGDAERCFARGFRLARDNGHIALRLAEIYANTDRRGDALNALELCLREGCTEREVAWEAGLTALSLNKQTLAITCLDQYEQFAPGEAWTNYYRALAMLESDRAAEAIEAIDLESERNPQGQFSALTVRAAAVSGLNDADGLRGHISQLMTLRLSDVDYLTEPGLLRLFELLHAAVEILPEDDPQRLAAEKLAVQAGMAPDDYFERFRTGEIQEEIGYYTCEFEQPLGGEWFEAPGCLHGQEQWPGYIAAWGVLAHDAQEAERIARKWQDQCADASPDLLDVSLRDEGFRDVPGVVWQATHAPVPDDDASGDIEPDLD